MVLIEVSAFVKVKLENLKKEEGHKTFDGVVRSLLERNERNR